MVKFDFDNLQSGKCHQACCVHGAEDHWCCSLDWPFSDVPGCDAYAYMRNGLYSRYGYPFSEPKWRDEFADEPYYRRREDFDPKWLSPAAKGNVEKLKQLEEDHVGCTP